MVEKPASPTAILRAWCHWRPRPLVLVAEVDPTLAQIVGGHFDRDPVAGEDADAVFLHSTGRIGQRLVPIVELDAKSRVGEQLLHGAVELDQIFFSQTDLLVKGTGAPKHPRINIARALSLDRAQINRGNAAALALLELVVELLTLAQIVHPRALDGGNVNEHVSAGGVGLDEPVTLLRIEPFDRTGRH